MKCVSYTRTIPWKNHKGELTIADQNQRIAEYLAEHKELNLQKRYSDRKNAENAGAAFDKMIDDGVEQNPCDIHHTYLLGSPGRTLLSLRTEKGTPATEAVWCLRA